jgi:predicted transcriptional regulator
MAKNIPKVSGMDWIVDNFSKDQLEPDEFTVAMVAEKVKVSLSAARCKLHRMFESGEVTRRKVMVGGRHINAYKRAE